MYTRKLSKQTLSGAASAAILLVATASCSESEDAEALSVPSGTSAELSGVVADGYLEGATVFLDLNQNQVRDEGEPVSVPTDASGAFSLRLVGLVPEQVAASFLLAEVPDTAKDADDLGATLRAAGKSGFTLLSPVRAFFSVGDAGMSRTDKAVLSPLSTLVVAEMLAGGLSVGEAEASVNAALGLGDKALLQDFIASGDTALHSVARVVALSLGGATRALGTAGDGGVVLPPGQRVVAALQAAREQLRDTVARARDAGAWPPAHWPHASIDGGVVRPSDTRPPAAGRDAGAANGSGRSGGR